jgi:hypothetical protein
MIFTLNKAKIKHHAHRKNANFEQLRVEKRYKDVGINFAQTNYAYEYVLRSAAIVRRFLYLHFLRFSLNCRGTFYQSRLFI